MEVSSTATLFYRGPGEVYSNHKQLTQAILLGQSDQELLFDIVGTSQTIEAIRLHLISDSSPVNISYIKLYGLHIGIRAEQTGHERVLLDLNSAEELQKYTKIDGLVLNKKILGELYVVDDSDPNIELHFSEPVTIDSSHRLQVMVSMEYLFSDDYLLARDLFLVNQERLEQEMRSMESDFADLKSTNEVFATYQCSPFWTTFMRLHRTYERFIRLKEIGLVNACVKIFQPTWWSRRNQTDYEKWRAAKGYENREKQ